MPSLLLMAKDFNGHGCTVTFGGCILGTTMLAAALSKFQLVEMRRRDQGLCVGAAPLLITPGWRARRR